MTKIFRLIFVLMVTNISLMAQPGKIYFENCGKDYSWNFDDKKCEKIDYSINPDLFKLVKGVFFKDKNISFTKTTKINENT